MAEHPPANFADPAANLARHAQAIERPIACALERAAGIPQKLKEAMAYSLSAGGKRLRPALVLESAHACGAAGGNSSAIAAAVAMELIHTFSLMHDDLPAMDDDDLRRGRPTNHKIFGEAMAILAGDALVMTAFETLAVDADSSVATALVRELAAASGAAGMIGGQVLDIEGEQKELAIEELQRIHRMKTGALLTASVRMGAIAANDQARLGEISTYGQYLGLAFQIVDDLLDVTSTPQQLGKATQKDAGRNKNTYPRLIGLEASKAEAQKHVETAVAALKSFDSRADGLRAIAQFVVARQF
ncbi:MAG TPA: farnesyl diphosphate synthase [Tepidisphaeraceae bacterium]